MSAPVFDGARDGYTLLLGDCLEVMRTLPAESVQCCVTSPPYYGLRSYVDSDHPDKPLEIGTEETPEAYVAKLVDVFREVRRVLRDDGVLWLNLGDSYNGSGGAGGDYSSGGLKEGQPKYPGRRVDGLKPKDIIGIPWMCAFALRADGWYLRSEIIWHKRAPMPESVTDRPTKAHEQLFLLAKSQTYYYDSIAIAEPLTRPDEAERKTPAKFGGAHKHIEAGKQSRLHSGNEYCGTPTGTRNRRSVWTLGPEPYHEAHFAVMPTKLIEPCILAGTSAHGCCAKCGAPWERVTESANPPHDGETNSAYANGTTANRLAILRQAARARGEEYVNRKIAVGWQPTCTCNADVVPCTVLDPFSGSGTTGVVSLKHNRRYIGIELNPDYIQLAHKRITQSQPLLLEVTP